MMHNNYAKAWLQIVFPVYIYNHHCDGSDHDNYQSPTPGDLDLLLLLLGRTQGLLLLL